MTDKENDEQLIQIHYTNYKGIHSLRTVLPKQIIFKATKWHPEKQWLLTAWDIDRKADRDFALKDCNFIINNELPEDLTDFLKGSPVYD